MEVFTLFLSRVQEEFYGLICKFISFILGNPKHLNRYNILGEKAFQKNFNLKEFLKVHYIEILKDSSENLWEIEEVVNLLIETLDKKELLEYRTGNNISLIT